MRYRLPTDVSVVEGLQQLMRHELKKARSRLRASRPPSDEAIHAARKAIKKVRAIVKLIESDDGRGIRRSVKQLRKLNRTLSRLRDADAMIGILTQLKKKSAGLVTEHTFARIRRGLVLRKQSVMAEVDKEKSWTKIDEALTQLRRKAKRWWSTHHGFRALEPGITATHRRGRRALTRALQHQHATDFHELRKELKTLYYELRLVEPRHSTDVSALHRAEAWLGEDHNVVVLRAELAKDRSLSAGLDRDGLERTAARYQRRLRRQAVKTVRRIYRKRSADYTRAFRHRWKQLRDGQRKHHRGRHAA